MRIGYYVHHHGRGHATRAGVIGAALTARGHEVTYLGSGALPDIGARDEAVDVGAALAARGHEVTHLGSGALPDVSVHRRGAAVDGRSTRTSAGPEVTSPGSAGDPSEGTQPCEVSGSREGVVDGGIVGSADHVVLTPDADAGDAPFVDADAHGRLHWAPLDGGYTERSAQIAAWVAQARPDVVVVDVSVEVSVLVRLLGVPIVVVGQPGRRDDAAHALAFDLAAAVLAPWPDGLGVAPHLERLGEKVVRVGGVSRFAGHRVCSKAVVSGSACPAPNTSGGASPGPSSGDSPSLVTHGDAAKMAGGAASDGPVEASLDATSLGAAEPSRPLGVLLVGGEGWDDAGLPDAVVRGVPEVVWRAPDADVPVETLLAAADVVVTHAGQNALADVASFGVPAVVVPQERPFDEQADMARALDAGGIAYGLTLGATADEVTAAVRAILAGDDERSTGAAWAHWCIDGAADRAADVIEAAARGGMAEGGRHGS